MGIQRILVTGGAGYVGSHTVLELLSSGYHVCVIDNFSNAVKGRDKSGKPESILRVEKLTGKPCEFAAVDLLDEGELKGVFKTKGPFDAVIHFAALKAVGESCSIPLKYYKNNLTGSVNLLEIMGSFGVKNFVFSSSSTVYGDPQYLPITEAHPTGNCVNPYGKTKYMMEEIMKDLAASDPEWKVITLRYFNPVGAHPSGEIGEDPVGTPNNLMPFVTQVAIGRRPFLNVFGNDYETPDGTGIRDYIHVVDLALGHVSALKRLEQHDFKGWKPYNLGTGKGHSVLELVQAFEDASGKKVPIKIVARRPGDVGASFAECELATQEFGWKAERSLEQMCKGRKSKDSWNWQSKYPDGFVSITK